MLSYYSSSGSDCSSPTIEETEADDLQKTITTPPPPPPPPPPPTTIINDVFTKEQTIQGRMCVPLVFSQAVFLYSYTKLQCQLSGLCFKDSDFEDTQAIS